MSVPPFLRCQFIQRFLFFSLYSIQHLCSEAFMRKHPISIRSRSTESPLQVRGGSGACSHSVVRWDAPSIVPVDIRGVFFFFFKRYAPYLAAYHRVIVWRDALNCAAWMDSEDLGDPYGINRAVFNPCIQDGRRVTRIPQVRYRNAVLSARARRTACCTYKCRLVRPLRGSLT